MAHSSLSLNPIRSWPEPHAPQQVRIARVVQKRFVSREIGDVDQQGGPKLEIFFEPGESLILLAEAPVHGSEIHRRRLAFGVSLLQFAQYRHSLRALP